LDGLVIYIKIDDPLPELFDSDKINKPQKGLNMKKIKFEAKIFEGHKELIAIHLPFKPEKVWGKKERYFVKGRVKKHIFEGEIGFRRGFHYFLFEEVLLKKAGLTPGNSALFTLELRQPSLMELEERPRLAWVRLVKS
jgi:Domain of unknown function (DUF1905)